MNYLIPFSLLLLFTPQKINTGLVLIRPFDGLVIVMLVWTLLGTRELGHRRLSAGFLLLLPYFAWHVLSALTVDMHNGLREGVQILEMTAFAFVLVLHVDQVDYARIGRILFFGLLAIMAFNIAWHIANGFWTGWKRLNDPKAAFTFLPLVLGCILLFAPPRIRRYWGAPAYWAVWGVVGIAILLSGERKALFSYGILSVALLSKGRLLKAIPTLGAFVGMLSLVAATTQDAYLQKQLGSVLDPLSVYREDSALKTSQGAISLTSSLSNDQRTFAFNLSKKLIAEHPLYGVGTNAYEDIIEKTFFYLPDYLRASIHGEFIRVLTENGLLGLALYLSIWGLSFLRLRRVLRYFVNTGVMNGRQAAVYPILFYAPFVLYVGFEAAGSWSFVVLIVVSMLPELTMWALRAPSAATSPRRSLCATSAMSRPLAAGPRSLPSR